MSVLNILIVFWGICYLTGVDVLAADNCPPEAPFVNCTVSNPCSFSEAICPQDPTARCRPDYCGGCIARFYDDLNNELHCEQDFNVICEVKNNTVGCLAPPGSTMHITYANYGRKDNTTCQHVFDDKDYHFDTNCQSEKSTMKIVKALCEGKPSCHLRALNSIYGDPCPGVYKYLEVDFICVFQVGNANINRQASVVGLVSYAVLLLSYNSII
ncbi:unnamed protein product [Owenia fusiformis]|uniref:SUEL-type lectin domain-containing protein n=1 Tax=Owenia fusiformis TaxID=6347 RepID=A0A8S4QBV0_OWEFU|nr:unnamed protein product [Owenia fusiformis]